MEKSILPPTDLKIDFQVNPIGLDDTKPRFSWTLSHGERGVRQSAYRILVSSSLENLEKDIGDVSDSGKVNSNQNIVEYSGKPLESRRRYYWKVKWWDDKGNESRWSEIAYFEMGLLKSEDWSAKWISGGKLFRKSFHVDKEIKQARIYVSGLGYYELRINGKRVGDRYLDPGQTDYDKIVLYTAYDVTDYLKKGENAIGVILGNGRFYMKPERRKSYKHYGDPRLILQLEVEYIDGSKEIIVSDESWKTTKGPIVDDDIYDGEVYDARLEEDGWDMPGFNDSHWENAKVADSPKGKLFSSANFPPIRRIGVLQPLKILNPKPRVYVFDFGQNFTGWVRIVVTGPRGAEVRIRYAELLNPDGTINVLNLRSAKATDVYILKGNGMEDYEPRFTYHGFRYAEITSNASILIHKVEGVIIHTDVQPIGFFACSNQLLNDIHRVILWSQRSNLMSIPTDCPQRDERMGWTGDAWLSAEEAILNFDMTSFYLKWLRDIREAQREDGNIPDTVPPYWNTYPADPCWGKALVVIPWLLYLYYGDRKVLEENYEAMKKWIDFLSTKLEGNILEFSKYGDWARPGYSAHGENVSTLCYYEDLLIMSKISTILGKSKDSEIYKELANRIKNSFNKEYFLSEQGYYVRWIRLLGDKVKHIPPRVFYSQTLNTIALYLNMVPHDKIDSVINSLVYDIIEHDYHLYMGIIGIRYILDTLTKYNHDDIAYRIMTQTTYPSFGYMIKEGATTLWERWEYMTGPNMNSHNHIMFGSVDTWFYKTLAGINFDEEHPGFERVIIKPHIVEDLKYVSASIKTIRGLIVSRWHKNHDSLVLEVVIPVNSSGIVYIPVKNFKNPVIKENNVMIWKDNKFVSSSEGIYSGRRENDYVVLEIGSGSYTFVVQES